ncbi:hypothetical protein PsYK624_003610 [Phanerochaete sordida]|uniref:F-box domain-containing protein n=1 Tax=Phanerochaete sordida TaxID=48140 RepID=A0A9P3FXZ2_9APHY|nr:hypothetical protein PsYK624_003610 [Phanerochaete sordida]
MRPSVRRCMEVEDILRIIVRLLDPEDLQSLSQVQPFSEVALDELHRVCTSVSEVLGEVCVDRSAGIPGHEGCVGRPPAEEKEFRHRWDQVQLMAARVKKISFDEVSEDSCVGCLWGAARALLGKTSSPLFPNVTQIAAHILSTSGLSVFALLLANPITLTKLDVTVSGNTSPRALARVLQGLPTLEHLRIETNRTTLTRIPLSTYEGLSPRLRTLRIVDTNALAYDRGTLARFLRAHPRLTALALNPAPERVGDRAQLPGLCVLEALAAQPHPAGYAPALARFAALLRGERAPWGGDAPSPVTGLRVLDFGASASDDGDAVEAYVRALFPNARVHAEWVRVEQGGEDAQRGAVQPL